MDSARLEVAPGAHLDTVRALHQTVVSLRTALEVSKNELKELKQKYEQHTHCLEYTDIIEKLTLENHILRRRIIDTGFEEKEIKTPNIKLQVTYSPRLRSDEFDSEVVIKTATTDARSTVESEDLEKDIGFCSSEKLNEIDEIIVTPDVKVLPHLSEQEEESESAGHKASLEENKEDSSNKEDSYREDSCAVDNVEEGSDLPPEGSEDSKEEVEGPLSQITSYARFDSETTPPKSFKTKLELLSKFDVRIKVRTLKEEVLTSSTTSDSDSTDEKKDKFPEKDSFRKEKRETDPNFEFTERREHFENKEDQKGNSVHLKAVSTENIKMAVPNEGDGKSRVDKFDVQVKITSEENLVVKEHVERSRRKDTLNLDVDNLSLRSMSEGDNSVFSEGGTTPLGPTASAGGQDKDGEGSGNESEEVDDIELIFTTDESKDMSNLQEDLVSIRETGDTGDSDQWAPTSASTHSTPVLIKFHTLDPDFQPRTETSDNAENENQENTSLQDVIAESSLRMKRVSLPNDKEIRHVAFNGKGSLDLPGRGILKSCDNKSDITLYKKSPNTSSRRLDSVDSLTCEYNRGLSFDNTKSSSFELGSSMDILHREESMDSFHKTAHLGHRFSVFAETDISKCGISEDDLLGNLNVRRNTCPNPFQYRVPPRYGSRISGPLRAGGVLGTRGARVAREPGGPRREAGAQTELSALPPRWGSDGHLAYKMSTPTIIGAPPVVPRASGPRRLTVPDARPPPRTADETRRVLLSDIGFTSMVPELSRSADPVWALSKLAAADASPLNASKFLSRGSSYRSPCLSIDQSTDCIPQHSYSPIRGDGRVWRSSLPDVRGDDTDELLQEAESFLRRSIDNLRSTSLYLDRPGGMSVQGAGRGQPYIPAEPKLLRLGHTVKVITPHGRLALGRVRYVGIAGGGTTAGIMVGAEFPVAQNPQLPRNDGLCRSRRYFRPAPLHTALFVPFSKVVMAWAT